MSNKSGRQSAPNRPGGPKARQPQRPQQQPQRQSQQSQQSQKQVQNRQPTLTSDSQVLTAERSGQSTAAARQQEKQQARLERQAVARAEAARRKRMRSIQRMAIFGALALAFVGLVSFLVWRESNRPGRAVDMMTSNHVQGESGVTYNSDPPTSGPHSPSVPAFTVYTKPITKELQIHGLEDGGVVINYIPDTDTTTIERLESLVRSYNALGGKKGHVLVAPYPEKFRDSDAKIAITAWRRIDFLDEYDEQRLRRFIDEYVGIDRHGESGS
ncbi:MAG: DUF3105 domain-containing protein [Chloroflexota bacterium]|nr:DUF3105 domain-containing protein [Chloroflexota bacterium]MDQ5867384.1 DUF3105 domain-containing protein [Chloroflexota bacterium]